MPANYGSRWLRGLRGERGAGAGDKAHAASECALHNSSPTQRAGRSPGFTEGKARGLAPRPMTQAQKVKAGPHQGPTQCWGCCEENAFVNQTPGQTIWEAEVQGRDRSHYEGPGGNNLLSSTQSGPAKLLHSLQKARGWERKHPHQEEADSSLMKRRGFPVPTYLPTLPSRSRHTTERWHEAPLMREGSFPMQRLSGFLGTCPQITCRLLVTSVKHQGLMWPKVCWASVGTSKATASAAPEMLHAALLGPEGLSRRH